MVLLPAVMVLLLGTGFDLAGAHAVVIESSPTDNEVLTSAPGEVVLRFNAKIEKSLARVTLATSAGRIIPMLAPMKEHSRATPDRLVITLPNIGPGDYLLRYKVLSVDGHVVIGVLRFSVVSKP
jgi:methionine-rich copper-binding protein CopC